MSIYLVEFNIVGNTPEEFKTEFKELFKLDTVYIEFNVDHIGEVAVRLRYLFRTYQPKWYGIVNLSRFFRIYHEIEINGFTVRHLKKNLRRRVNTYFTLQCYC